jgi:hypothetical protein
VDKIHAPFTEHCTDGGGGAYTTSNEQDGGAASAQDIESQTTTAERSMMVDRTRPKKGLAPEPALKRWSDDARLYAEMDALSDAWQPCSSSADPPPPRVARYREYVWRRTALEDAFTKKLREGQLIASGRLKGSNERAVIDPDQWDELEVDFMLDNISGSGMIFRSPEFFEPIEIPLNIRVIPPWLTSLAGMSAAADNLPLLIHDAKYNHVEIGSFKFTFGDIQARVIRQLHEARKKEGEGWCVGKNLMADAGSRQRKVSDLFRYTRDIEQLLESDERGQCRLKAR